VKRRIWSDGRERELWNWWAFLSERGLLTRHSRRDLINACWRSFPDALWQRFDREESPRRARRILQSAGFCLCAALLPVLTVALFSRGFERTRRLVSPPAYSAVPELVAIATPARFVGHRMGISAHALALWQEQSKAFTGIAGYSFENTRLTGFSGVRKLRAAQVTANFFSVLGVRPALGEDFAPQDAARGLRCVLLGHDFWVKRFDANAAVVGREIVLNDGPALVTGILPREFRFLTRDTQVWQLMDINRPRPGLLGVVGRLRQGVTRTHAQAELEILQLKSKSIAQPVRVDVAILRDRVLASLSIFRLGLTISMLIALGAALLHFGKPGLFLIAKASLLVTGVTAVWAELIDPAVPLWYGFQDPVIGGMSGWVYLLTCAAALYWAIRDQKRRCPVCLYRLGMPVRIGSWSSPLLDPVSTELICEKGHGVLYVPETQSSDREPEKWKTLDASWRELFTK
jgi:hypothetical protein